MLKLKVESPTNKLDEYIIDYDFYISSKEKYQVKTNQNIFTIDTKYKYIETIGKGAYGQVIKVCDTSENEENQFYALKKITNIFDHNHYEYAKRCLRELIILRILNHENVRDIN